MSAVELLQLFGHFMLLSMLSIGGAITVAPEMHRYVVDEHAWITDAQFTASISLAQASPGPNVLFVTLIGWNAAGWVGALAATVGIMLPSSLLAIGAARWTRHRHQRIGVQAFRKGMVPITIGLLLATGWILAEPGLGQPVLIGCTLASAVLVTKTRINPLWLILAGGALGVLVAR